MQSVTVSELRKREHQIISQTENCINIMGCSRKNIKEYLAKLLSKEDDSRKIVYKCGVTYFDKREYRGWHMMTKEHIQKMEELYQKSI